MLGTLFLCLDGGFGIISFQKSERSRILTLCWHTWLVDFNDHVWGNCL